MRRLEGRIEKLEAKVDSRNVCNVLVYDPSKTTAQAALAQYGVPGVRYMIVTNHGTDAEWEAALRQQQLSLKRLTYESSVSDHIV
jgi:hypothetical protein